MAGNSDSKEVCPTPCGGPKRNVVKQSPSASANKALQAQHGKRAGELAPTRLEPVKS